MGQTIEINRAFRVGDSLVVICDRTLAGQDGEAYTPGTTAGLDTWPARLAERLFASDGDIQRVHVMSNAVTITRSGGWTPEAEENASAVVRDFFRYY
ncbi:MAG TPA: hypothetical protein VF377_04390 [Acidimicrobiia bacterium]|jgi:hypothetical protein